MYAKTSLNALRFKTGNFGLSKEDGLRVARNVFEKEFGIPHETAIEMKDSTKVFDTYYTAQYEPEGR